MCNIYTLHQFFELILQKKVAGRLISRIDILYLLTIYCLLRKFSEKKEDYMAKYKYASWMAAFILGLGIVGYKPVKEAFTEAPVDKNITLVIYKDNNYTSEVYDYSVAQVHVIVERVKGEDHRVELDTTFDAKLLKEYPSAKNAYIQKVMIPNVFANKEEIEVKYILTYYSGNSQLQIQNSLVLKGENERVKIGI
jgi:hypothetical protein